MTEELKGLIEKIQQEGVRAAEDKAKAIGEEAKHRAEEIIEKAKLQAKDIVAAAEARVAKLEENYKNLLKQAGRDLILNLQKEINDTLDKIINSSIGEALAPEELAKIISALIMESSRETSDKIIISFKKEDFEKLKKDILGKLKEGLKKEIVLKSSEDITGGFVISYDAGRSHYDFTDKALAGYIGSYLKPKLAEIFKESI